MSNSLSWSSDQRPHTADANTQLNIWPTLLMYLTPSSQSTHCCFFQAFFFFSICSENIAEITERDCSFILVHDLIIACCVCFCVCVCVCVCVFGCMCFCFLDLTQLKECKWSFFHSFLRPLCTSELFLYSPPVGCIRVFSFLPIDSGLPPPQLPPVSRHFQGQPEKNCELPHLWMSFDSYECDAFNFFFQQQSLWFFPLVFSLLPPPAAAVSPAWSNNRDLDMRCTGRLRTIMRCMT